jgi:hypothetical protein
LLSVRNPFFLIRLWVSPLLLYHLTIIILSKPLMLLPQSLYLLLHSTKSIPLDEIFLHDLLKVLLNALQRRTFWFMLHYLNSHLVIISHELINSLDTVLKHVMNQ